MNEFDNCCQTCNLCNMQKNDCGCKRPCQEENHCNCNRPNHDCDRHDNDRDCGCNRHDNDCGCKCEHKEHNCGCNRPRVMPCCNICSCIRRLFCCGGRR